ncbi:hypothetical protein DRE_03869 [Drechslerella stenobrocha 248]|uniref:ACB domain-containing protein n=1 Tax=Drechslerella stenobrocha 248 TaxID=1043628 RepID=W7I391_9PEZI|nr:hypothetical protein DRE_03869 [Drechslerella stenobrocha 248]
MADSVDRVFVHALNTVKKLPRSGSSRPPPEDRLKLYGLYKQSMEGDVDGMVERPTGTSDQELTEAKKWDCWNEQKGLSKTEAKRRYITTLIEAMHRYAINTPDACELVAELEFVWDQIKSNQQASSPPSTAPGHQQREPSSLSAASTPRRNLQLGLSHHQSVSAAGLQILPPMSPTDDGGRFTTFPPIGMGVQTDDEEAGNRADNDNSLEEDEEDEHYETMDEFDENGLPRVTVIHEPLAAFKGAAAGIGSPSRGGNAQMSPMVVIDPSAAIPRRKHTKHPSSSHHSQPLTATRRSIAAALSSSSSSAAQQLRTVSYRARTRTAAVPRPTTRAGSTAWKPR